MNRKGWLLLLFLLVISLLIISGEVLAGDQVSIIDSNTSFVLYQSISDSWLKDADSDRMILSGFHPRLSPDGRYILVKRMEPHTKLYLYDLETEEETKIFEGVQEYIVGFSWSVDGSRIYYDKGHWGCHIFTMNRDGTDQNTPVIGYWPLDAPMPYGCYNVAPEINPIDGSVAWYNQYYGIAVMDVGQDPHLIKNTKPWDTNPRWSPDGEWIAFTRDGNLYKIQPEGNNLTQLTFLSESNFINDGSGAWEKSGSWIFAAVYIYLNDHLFAIATDGSGRMIPVHTKSIYPDYVGDAGRWDFNFTYLYLPLVKH